VSTAASDPAEIVTLAARIASVNGELSRAGQRGQLAPLPTVRVLVVGPTDAGKTTLVRGLLADAATGLPGLFGMPLLPTAVPVEFTLGSGTVVTQELLDAGGRPRSHHVSPDSLDVFAAKGLRQMRVGLDSSVLRDWNIELLDTPGTDGEAVGGLRSRAGRAGREGVLYVIPSRGLTERDVYVLETLRGLPVVVVENLRDEEISASSEVFSPLAIDQSTPGSSLPIALSRLGKPEPERGLIRLAVALLHAELLGAERWLLLGSARDLLRQLRTSYSARLDVIIGARAVADPLGILYAVSDLMAMEREGPGLALAESSLEALIAILSAVPAAGEFGALVADIGRAAADRYNVEAVIKDRPQPPSSTAQVAPSGIRVGEAFGHLRDALRGYVAELAGDKAMRFTEADRSRLRLISDQAAEDRFQMVFVGQYSSGKSTLINALLDKPDLLPARRRPTTTTINELRYADRPSVDVQWLAGDALPLEVTLLDRSDAQTDGTSRLMEIDDAPGRYRVHAEEISALAAWLRDGAVRPGTHDWTLEISRVDAVVRRADPAALFRDLYRDLQAARTPGTENDHLPEYVYTTHYQPLISGATFPLAVKIKDFATPPPPVPDGREAADDVGRILDTIGEDPAVALRVDRVQIGYDHELLRHLTVVDTPGTDAPIPRHRVVTESAIKEDRQRAVVYCFNGTKAASTDDYRNLDLLKACLAGSGELSRSRFFFVITQRDLLRPDEQKEVLARVRGQLKRVGIVPGRIYFTTVKGTERNDEFDALAGALNQFGVLSKGPLLNGWTAEIMQVVRDVGERERSLIARMGQDESQHRETLATLNRELAAMRELASELTSNQAWGIPWTQGRAEPAGLSVAGDFAQEIAALLAKDDFTAFAQRADNDLAEINRRARDRVENAWGATVARARAQLAAGPARGRTIALAPVSIAGEIFSSAEILHAARSCRWRSGWERFKGLFGRTGWNQDVEDNRDRIAQAWTTSSRNAARAVDRAIGAAAEAAKLELDRVAEGIGAEIRSMSKPPSQTARRQAEASRERSDAWLARLGSLSRTIEENARGTR
jgi:hypothetical protein